MNSGFPDGWRVETLDRSHPREGFDCGERAVNEWLRTRARQSQDKHLSITKVLVDEFGAIAGFYTLAHNHVHLDQLPPEIARRLPRQMLPVVTLAWLGVDLTRRSRGLGDLLLARALADCCRAGAEIPFVAIVVDCINESARAFFARHEFVEFPGKPLKLILSKTKLDQIARDAEQ